MPKGSPGQPRKPLSQEHRDKLAEAARRRFSDPKQRKQASKAAVKRFTDPKQREHLSKVSSSKGNQERRKATMLERHGVEFAKQLPQLNYCRKEYWIAQGLSPAAARDKIWEIQSHASTGRENVVSHWSLDYWLAKGYSEKRAREKISHIQSLNSAKSPVAVSNIGSNFLDCIEECAGIGIEREQVFRKKFRVDGVIKELKIIIEFFGSFWHMHPALFASTDVHKVTGWKAQSKWNEDAGRIKYMTMCGYQVFVVWDTDDLDLWVKKIAKEIKNASSKR